MDDYQSIVTTDVGNGTRSAYLEAWNEEVLFNIDDVDDGQVIAQGQRSGKYYLLDLDDFMNIADAQLYI